MSDDAWAWFDRVLTISAFILTLYSLWPKPRRCNRRIVERYRHLKAGRFEWTAYDREDRDQSH